MYIRKVRYRIGMVKTRQDRSGDSRLASNKKPFYVIVMIPVRDSSDKGKSYCHSFCDVPLISGVWV
jgi:hypothetical protein